jgi:Glu-tRNA(Gln) amidotransferase subunit E-like FAD-binding protein
MMAKPQDGEFPYIDPSDENSKFYTKPDVPPIPHPADFLEALKVEFPEASMDELVAKADIRVAAEVLKRKATQTDTLLTINTIPEEGASAPDDEVPDSPAA